ncbi:hypothetical protein D3C83_188030 [compost metagenome]
MPDDRVVAQHGVLFLGNVVDDQDEQPAQQHEPEYRADAVGNYTHHAVHPAPYRCVRIAALIRG